MMKGCQHDDYGNLGGGGGYGPLKDLVIFFSAPCLVGVKFSARTGSFLSHRGDSNTHPKHMIL